jgi:Pyocin large subunit
MSRAATDWVWDLQIKPATLKLILLSMADRADEEHQCFPSISRLEKDTSLNRKTIQDGINTLIEMQLVEDTGERRGATKRVRVLRLRIDVKVCVNASKIGNISNFGNVPKNGGIQAESNEPKNGLVSDGVNDPEIGNVPNIGNIPKNGTLNDPDFGTLNDPNFGTQNLSVNPTVKHVGGTAVAVAQKQPVEKLNYESILDSYHELLPEMPQVKILTDSRKKSIRSFWKTFQFTDERWKAYLKYIGERCRWMLEDRPNGKGGFWKRKNLDYLITERCYVAVKEERANDNNDK